MRYRINKDITAHTIRQHTNKTKIKYSYRYCTVKLGVIDDEIQQCILSLLQSHGFTKLQQTQKIKIKKIIQNLFQRIGYYHNYDYLFKKYNEAINKYLYPDRLSISERFIKTNFYDLAAVIDCKQLSNIISEVTTLEEIYEIFKDENKKTSDKGVILTSYISKKKSQNNKAVKKILDIFLKKEEKMKSTNLMKFLFLLFTECFTWELWLQCLYCIASSFITSLMLFFWRRSILNHNLKRARRFLISFWVFFSVYLLVWFFQVLAFCRLIIEHNNLEKELEAMYDDD